MSGFMQDVEQDFSGGQGNQDQQQQGDQQQGNQQGGFENDAVSSETIHRDYPLQMRLLTALIQRETLLRTPRALATPAEASWPTQSVLLKMVL